MHVMGPGGQEVSLSDDQQAEIRSLALSMLGGDPAARRAAAERLRQIKAEARGGGMRIGPGEGFSGHGISGHGISGQPSAPDPCPHVSPPPVGSPSTFGSGGSFDFGAGEGTTEQRIARLQQLLDRGILTESEFQAQRQQIIGGQ